MKNLLFLSTVIIGLFVLSSWSSNNPSTPPTIYEDLVIRVNNVEEVFPLWLQCYLGSAPWHDLNAAPSGTGHRSISKLLLNKYEIVNEPWKNYWFKGGTTDEITSRHYCMDDNSITNWSVDNGLNLADIDGSSLKFKVNPNTRNFVWLDLLTQCSGCTSTGTGNWWKFEKWYEPGQMTNILMFGITLDPTNFEHEGTPPCNLTTVYGCGAGEEQ